MKSWINTSIFGSSMLLQMSHVEIDPSATFSLVDECAFMISRLNPCALRGKKRTQRWLTKQAKELVPERRIDVPIVFLSHSSLDASVAQSLKEVFVRLRKSG